MTAQQQFAARVQELIRTSKQLSPAARKITIEVLEEARRKIVAEVASLDPASFTAAQLTALKHSIERTLDEFRGKMTAGIQALEEKSFSIGASTVAQPLAAVDALSLPLGRVSRNALSIAQGYTADLITNLSRQAASNVNGVIQRAFLGGQSLTDILAQIGRAVSGGQTPTLFSKLMERATVIGITEVLRIHSIAAQAQLEEAAQRHPDLKKQWLWIHAALRPRLAHQIASGQVVAVDEAFDVAGEQLMYPRDPNGSAWNTINCHCLVRPYFEAAKSTASQRQILKDLGLAVEINAA